MPFIEISREGPVAVLALNRGKVNALNLSVVEELHGCFDNLKEEGSVKAIILTGQGKFFSFGFDIPEFLSQTRNEFKIFLKGITGLYAHIFQFPKPVIAALNGHTIAAGCMLANACDYRIMVSGKAKISLNELGFGSSVFAGSVAILEYWVGARNAREILFSAAMYKAEQAHALGLVDLVVDENDLHRTAGGIAAEYAKKDSAAFAAMKKLTRQPVIDSYADFEAESIEDFLDVWYSESTWKNLREIKIRE